MKIPTCSICGHALDERLNCPNRALNLYGHREVRMIKVDPGLLQMPVIARAAGAIYLRLPQDLQRECSGCGCDYCSKHPGHTPMWDTLVVAVDNLTRTLGHDWSWTVHMPDPQGFIEAVKRRE